MLNSKKYLFLITFALFLSCKQKSTLPQIGFVEAFEDATLAQAKKGFAAALAKSGYVDGKNIHIIYKNAQGNIPTLSQIVNYFINQPVDVLATSTTLSTLTALQQTKTVPIFMTVSPTPALMKITDKNGAYQSNLFGVAEDLNYIDASFKLIPTYIKTKTKTINVGMVYNQAEPQSVNALNRMKLLAKRYHINLISAPLNSSSEAQLVTQFLLTNHLDCFFANPDNTVFASFETILEACNKKQIPIFTSEAGLVQRGAVCAYGADIFQWGYQAGLQAAQFLKNKSTKGLKIETVKIRKLVYNPAAAKKYHLVFPANFQKI